MYVLISNHANVEDGDLLPDKELIQCCKITWIPSGIGDESRIHAAGAHGESWDSEN